LNNYNSILNPDFILKDTPIRRIEDPLILDSGVKLFVKREDLNHPQMSGNKWHKLKYNLLAAKKERYETLLTFGGAFSNHIYATAAAGKLFGFNTIGIIRGEEHLPLNPTLSFAKRMGMEIHYIDRRTYRTKNDPHFIKSLYEKFGKFYLVPEGGTNSLAVKGVSEIIESLDTSFDYVCCACGTGGTLAGLITGLNGRAYALGFSVLKGGDFLIPQVKKLIGRDKIKNWNIKLDYHLGGYAKINRQLVEFTDRFQQVNKILVEPIYTGKMLFGIYDLIQKGFFNRGETIISIHTGGLQGIEGMKAKINELRERQA